MPATPLTCPICLSNPALTREHVWPNWFLQRMDEEGPPPFGWTVNGQPALSRTGVQIKGMRRQRVVLDVCDPCNATMNTTIEQPVKEVVTALALNGWRGRYKREQWRAVGIWWAKVILLVGHPDSKLENDRLHQLAKMSFDGAPPDLKWLTDGSGPPKHLSVFVHRTDLATQETQYDLVVPARVHFPGGETAHCHMLTLATPGLCVTLVSHPGIKIHHPMVKRGEAWELLHAPPRCGNLARLRNRSHKYVRYMRGGGVPSGHVVDESEFSFLTAAFDYEADQLPPVSALERLKARALRMMRIGNG